MKLTLILIALLLVLAGCHSIPVNDRPTSDGMTDEELVADASTPRGEFRLVSELTDSLTEFYRKEKVVCLEGEGFGLYLDRETKIDLQTGPETVTAIGQWSGTLEFTDSLPDDRVLRENPPRWCAEAERLRLILLESRDLVAEELGGGDLGAEPLE